MMDDGTMFDDAFDLDGKPKHRLDMKRMLGFLVIAVVVGVLWEYPVLKPLRVFVVFLHEISHALMGVATGGQIVDIQVFLSEGGVARTVGGSHFWTLSAGYVGSLLWGGLILIVASRTRLTRALAIGIGMLLVGVTFAYVRNWSGFGFGLAFGAAMIGGGLLLREGVVNWLLRVIGLTSCLYAIYDILSDIIFRPEAQSDARMLAEATNFPPFLSATNQTLFWGVSWMAISLVCTAVILGIASRSRPKSEF